MKPINPIPDEKNKKVFDIVSLAVQRFKTEKPFVIGITGAGGAGKTTFGNNLVKYYGHENCISIDLDDYLISREERGKLGLTGYDPRANKLSKAKENIENLKQRITISKPRYDHTNGQVLENEIVNPREIIIIEGVTTLYPELKKLGDLSFFLDALEETQIQSRIERDVNQRGYTHEEAMILFESLKPHYAKHIKPTEKFASVIVEVGIDYVMHPIHLDGCLR